MMVECGICFAEYREDELELHREMCVVLLMFRCTLCHADFVSKEGLWNHLDQHEIADESKELHYQEMKAKYKLHQCVLCNDQRAYSELLYWNHVHNVHDGFFLHCSHCGQKFQSERHRNDHVLSLCKARDQMVASKCDDLEVDKVPIKIENETSDHEEEASRNNQQDASLNMNQSPVENLSNTDKRKSNRSRSAIDYTEPDPDIMIGKKAAVKSAPRPRKRVANVSSAEPLETKCFDCDKDYATAYLLRQHIRTCHKPIECTVCGITCYGADRARSHKISKHTDPSFECAKCLKKFHLKKHYTRHSYGCGLSSSEKNQLPVEVLIDKEKIRKSLLGREAPPVSQIDGPRGNSKPLMTDRTDLKIKQENPSNEETSSAQCSQCGIRESSAATLIRHILIHHEPVACDICGTTSSNFVQAQIHKEKVHKELKNKCPYCSIQVWGGMQFQRHVLKCKDLKFPCKLCGKTFANTSAVTEHTNICRPKPVWNDRINFNAAQGHDGTDSSTVIEKDVLPQNGLSDTKCYYCNEDYSSPGFLTHHLQTYHELMKCDICGIMILGISSRKLHKVFNHTEAKFPCPNCGKKFYQKGAYDKHWPNCERKKFSCEICGHRSKHLNIIRRHKRLEHPDCVTLEETVVSTQDDHTGQPKENLCTKVEDNANDLEEVRSNRPSLPLDRRNSNNDEEVKPLEDSRSSEHVLASESEDTDSHVVKSESRVLSAATSIDGCEIKSEKISPPLVENSSVQKYRCSVCDDTYSEFSDIREHMLSSHMDGLFQCQRCSKKCRTMKEMEEHAIICADRKYSCEFCGKKFKYRQGAKKHKNLFHPGTESTSNEIIKDTPSTEEQTSIKVEEIDGENSSEENSALQQQDEDSSSESDQPKCSYCAKSFSSEELLSRHIEKCHEPSACDICGLTFVAVGKARNHKINMHSKREKFECPYCPMKYLVYERYEQHLPICKSKEFPCDVCGIKFQEQRYVERHKKKVHEDQGTSKRARRKKASKAEKISDEKEISLLDDENLSTGSGEKKVQTSNPSNMRPHSGPTEIKMEINVEDTNLQEQQYQVLNVDQGISCASTAGFSGDQLQISKHPYDSKSEDAEAENTSLASAIKIKQEYQEEEDEGNSIGTTTTESSEYNGVTSGRNEPLVCHAGGVRVSPYYMTQIHTELLYNNPESELLFNNSYALQNRSNVPSTSSKKKHRLEDHTTDGFGTSEVKRIKIEKPD